MDAQQQGSHFFLIALRTQRGMLSHRAGHFTPQPGATRFDCLNQIQNAVVDADPNLREAVVTAFCLESNQL